MQKEGNMRCFGLKLFLALLLAAGVAAAGDSRWHKRVDGMSVYLGVIPSKLIKEDEKNMHGGAKGDDSYHILVALFDAESGERIGDARVKATVSSVGMRGAEKSLQPMSGELLSYGNYFTLDRGGRYDIEVEILRKGAEKPIVVDFDFSRGEE